MCWSSTLVTPVCSGRQSRRARTVLPRHRHEHAYVSLVLSGSLEEAGDRGRFRVEPGQVLVHAPFEGHRNHYLDRGAEVLNLVVRGYADPVYAVMRLADPDAAVRLAERNATDAASFLTETWQPVPVAEADWPDLLAKDIIRDPALRIHHWARDHDLADATVSRGFRHVFGVSPCGYRAQIRATRALEAISSQGNSFAQIAATYGFSDQSHMTHAIRSMTGRTPNSWRTQVK